MKVSNILKNIITKINASLQAAEDYADSSIQTALSGIEPQIYSASGYIASGNNGLSGYGIAVVCITGDKARIDFAFTIATTGSSGYVWGLNVIRLNTINSDIPLTLKPLGEECGRCTFYNSSGAIDGSLTGYGGTVNDVTGYSQLFGFGRIYDTDGNNGAWGENSIPVGTHIVGTCYGIIE